MKVAALLLAAAYAQTSVTFVADASPNGAGKTSGHELTATYGVYSGEFRSDMKLKIPYSVQAGKIY